MSTAAKTKCRWHKHEDGYNRKWWYMDATDRVVGKVAGSEFDNEWYAFKETETTTVRLGRYLSESAAQVAVEQSTRTAEVEP